VPSAENPAILTLNSLNLRVVKGTGSGQSSLAHDPLHQVTQC